MRPKKGAFVGKYRCEEIPCIVISVASTPFICLSSFIFANVNIQILLLCQQYSAARITYGVSCLQIV